jgi:hypothetical protein
MMMMVSIIRAGRIGCTVGCLFVVIIIVVIILVMMMVGVVSISRILTLWALHMMVVMMMLMWTLR